MTPEFLVKEEVRNNMENIELVIKIPKEIYDYIHNEHVAMRVCDGHQVASAIANGTPLHKGHSKLIDEKEIDTVVNGVFNDFDTYSPKTFLNVIHEQCIEAVGADKSENEE